jgi:hypothetical protein
MPARCFLLFALMWIALGVLTGRVPAAARQHRAVTRRGARSPPSDRASPSTRSRDLDAVHPHGWDYARHFIAWTIAYLPAFAALLVSPRQA